MASITSKTTHVAPYWGKSSDLKPGLNQLGIRNVSEYMFTTLLPGLNNVSQRIRYYSFYCWILTEFYKGKEKASEKEFQVFLRRCELLMAMICSWRDDTTGIPGINYAISLRDFETSPYSLQKGIYKEDGTTRGSYWANPGGIFRQYYSASLEEIAIIGLNANGNFYNATNDEGIVNGRILGDAFASSLLPKTRSKFLEIVKSGKVSKEQLKALAPLFNMKAPIKAPKETGLLIEMLLQKDRPKNLEDNYKNRRNTIRYALQYIDEKGDKLDGINFSKYMYEQYRSNRFTDFTAWGWYAYFLDDNWQYQTTILLENLLTKLRKISPSWIPVEEIADSLSSEIISALSLDQNYTLKDVINNLDRIKSKKNEMADAVLNLLFYYRENKDNLDVSDIHYKEIGATRDNHCKYMQKILQYKNESFYVYLKSIFREDIIYRHYLVSFTKMRQTGLATQKFSFENGKIRFLDGWESTHTSPRIDTLCSFLQDLDLITADNELTKLGAKTLKQLQNEDN